MTFDSGKEQRVVGGTIPAFEITLSYSNITLTKYSVLRYVYEHNFANTFKCLFDNKIDKRSQLMTNDAEVFMFKDFQFTADAKKPNIISGKITLSSSVFFNFPTYQNLFEQSSEYIPTITTDTSFINVLEDAQPNQVSYKYSNQSIMSNIGISGRHIKDKGLKRAWSLTWFLQETDFLKLLTFYRKKSGIMGEFGIPANGYNNTEIINARFMQDSIQYQRRLDGLFQVSADFIEVK
jgi:hypothetical protein